MSGGRPIAAVTKWVTRATGADGRINTTCTQCGIQIANSKQFQATKSAIHVFCDCTKASKVSRREILLGHGGVKAIKTRAADDRAVLGT